MKWQKVIPGHIIGKNCICHICRGCSPATTMKAFEPNTWPVIQVSNGGCYFRFDNIFRQSWLIRTWSLVPSLGAEIIAKLCYISPSSAMVAAKYQSPVL